MHFGENQLSPSSLGMSPLPTAPPTALQRGTVRASSGLSPRLTLAMGGSPGFGSNRRDSVSQKGDTPISDSLALRLRGSYPLASPRPCYSPVHSSIGTPSEGQALLRPTARSRFQDLFHPPRRGPFHRSLTVLCSMGRRKYSRLGGWSPQLPAPFLVQGGTHEFPPRRQHVFRVRGSHPLRPALPGPFR